jgi:cobalamin-dependent methionine synthase I
MDWEDPANKPVTPKMLGVKVIRDISIESVVDYIDWNPFFQARPRCIPPLVLLGTMWHR